MRYLLFFFLTLGLCRGEVAPDPIRVEVVKRDGRQRLVLLNTCRVPVTYKFEFTLNNTTVEDPSKLLVVVPAGGRTDGPVLLRQNHNREWQWNYSSYYNFGSVEATRASASFALPFSSGSGYKVIQGFDGDFSHRGADSYAVDFEMPIGTPVRAAREGMVVSVEERFDQGGPEERFREQANTVMICHTDGVLSRYVHLKKNGAEVVPGQWVKTGDLLGYSGNTGYSTEPHLHFDVFRPGRDFRIATIPFTLTKDGKSFVPVQGRVYRN